MLFLLSSLIGAYMVIIAGWNERLNRYYSELLDTKACLSDFEKEVRREYMPRTEISVYMEHINESLLEIKQKLK